jgi:hypothetical protein
MEVPSYFWMVNLLSKVPEAKRKRKWQSPWTLHLAPRTVTA